MMVRAGAMFIPEGDRYFAKVFARTGDRFQEDLYRAALHLAGRRRLAIDVGAHVGSWTRLTAKDFEHVVAFEPNHENYCCLCANAAGANATLFQIALGSTDQRCALALHGDNSGCWHVQEGDAVVEMPLDFYDLDPDLLKIDVEGYEGQVLTGAQRTLELHSPVVVIEDNGLGAKLYGAAWVDPKPLLAGLGYRLHTRIEKDEIWTR